MAILFILYTPEWVRYPLLAGLAFLAQWRIYGREYGQIYSIDTLPAASNVSINCSIDINFKYRTLDGTCNDLDYPTMGSVGTRFNRHTGLIQPQLSYPETINDTLLSPNPRNVARDLLHQTDEIVAIPAPHLNLIVPAWIQFMTHDWMFHGENSQNPDDLIRIPLSTDDPLYDLTINGSQFMEIQGTLKDATFGEQDADMNRPQAFNNYHTAWWDANQIYGVNQSINNLIRDASDSAKIKLDFDSQHNEWRLPTNSFGEIAGFTDNWWLGLSLLHTIFALEHNHIIDELRQFYGDDTYSNDELYHFGRLIISGLIAKIHTIEWTTAILNNDVDLIAQRTNWYGFEYAWFQTLFGGVTVDTNEYSFVQQLQSLIKANPVKGGTKNLYGANYQFTEAFVAVYRLHSLMPDEIELHCILDKDCTTSHGKYEFNLAELLDEQTVEINKNLYQNDLFYTFGTNNPMSLFLNSYSSIFTDLGDQHIDLATIDLLRQRERGVPRYNNFREAMGMTKIDDYSQLSDDTDLIKRVSIHYPDIDDLDLLIGVLLENEGGKRVPDGWIFGETQFAVFLESASRRLSADRFFTDAYTSEYYTEFGINYIELNTFKDILVRHYPNLTQYIPNNPFFTWLIDDDTDNDQGVNTSNQLKMPFFAAVIIFFFHLI